MVTPPSPKDGDIPTEGTFEERVGVAVDWLITVIETFGHTWIRVTGSEGVGADPEVQKIIDDADWRTADLLLDAVGFVGTSADRNTANVSVRCFGALAKAAAREWIERETIGREQVRAMLVTTLLALLRDATPR